MKIHIAAQWGGCVAPEQRPGVCRYNTQANLTHIPPCLSVKCVFPWLCQYAANFEFRIQTETKKTKQKIAKTNLLGTGTGTSVYRNIKISAGNYEGGKYNSEFRIQTEQKKPKKSQKQTHQAQAHPFIGT